MSLHKDFNIVVEFKKHWGRVVRYWVAMVTSTRVGAIAANKKVAGDSLPKCFVMSLSNFGKVNEFIYRGSQPKKGDYKKLCRFGIRTIIDLRDDPKSYSKFEAQCAGLHYINLPMNQRQWPQLSVVREFLTIVNNAEYWPIFIHCAGGRHRTGAMTAIYRMTYEGWDAEMSYAEMLQYDFFTRWGHKALRNFVYAFYYELAKK